MNVIEISHLNKWYRQVTALNDVTVAIGPGITGLLGANGAGKTSLLRIATGLLQPSGGSVRIFGESPWNNAGLHLRIGYCPEHDGIYEYMTGREFVTLLLSLRGFAPSRARCFAEEALEMVRLTAEENRKVYTYSKGMRQRLKIAQALAHRPDLLILDEPLTGADPIMRQDLIALIKGLAGQGRHVLVSSHVLHEIEQMTSAIILIHRGRLMAAGNIPEIRALLNRHPHTVRFKTYQARELATRFSSEPEVVSLEFTNGALSVRTDQPDAFFLKLPKIILEGKFEIDEMTSPDESLEAIFHYLTQ